MDKTFDHSSHEADIYASWERAHAFMPSDAQESFSIIMPPPNANDPLHIGHARFVTVQDVLVRYSRMKGLSTLWLPGSDHAGIETQFVFEKKLREKGKSRFDYDNETLFKLIWEYVEKNTGVMHEQLKKLGASCDWSRHKFTLDPDIQAIVYQTFKKLYDDGLVYRGKRIVNYCPTCGTNFSELEVDYSEQTDELFYINYGPVTVATTRPETIFADVAIAINPKDVRHKKLLGQMATIPLINRQIPIIADKAVEPDFGTGALKITPGHDPLDFEIGQRHNLTIMSVIDEAGKMINTPREFEGLRVNKARAEVVTCLEEIGAIVRREPITHSVGKCYRCKSVIEPLVSEQWFIEMKPLAKKALDAFKKKKVRFVTPRYQKHALHWLRNIRDWNVSRQIVWGMQIPAFKCSGCQKWTVTNGSAPAECECGSVTFTQDTDTFDTWFSSGQWPFATLQANKKGDFEKFYPTSVMETSYDIILFWVLRMIMLGLYVTDEVPFRDVWIHGLVRDKQGLKISKSKGNVIDPIEMVTLYGADALRMGLIWGALVENDVSLSEENIRAQRNFANKLWNVSRFTFMDNQDKKIYSRPTPTHQDDKNLLIILDKVIDKVTKKIETYKLSEAAECLYDFIWKDVASTYIESIKERKEDAHPTLAFVVQESLKLMHPFMPFVTEAVWRVNFSDTDLLINATWPQSAHKK